MKQEVNERTKIAMIGGYIGIAANIVLFVGKLIAGLVSGSVAITADAMNNMSDAGSSVVTTIGFALAGQKPDRDHPFGHGRIEYVSGFIVAGAILLMGIELIHSSVDKIIHPEMIEFSMLVAVILAVSVLVKLGMAVMNLSIAKKIDSAAVRATAKDSISDAIATSAVLIAMIIADKTGLQIDGYAGLLVGLLILKTGLEAAKDTIDPLLGQAPDPEFVEKINEIVMSFDDIIGVHDLVVHDYGPGRVMVSLHAEVPAKGDILKLHDTIDLAEHKLRNELMCEAVIHMDPILNDDEETIEYKKKVIDSIKEYDDIFRIHDFRIVNGPTHTNVIFDVVIPYSYVKTNDEVKEDLVKKIYEDTGCFAVMEIDNDYANILSEGK